MKLLYMNGLIIILTSFLFSACGGAQSGHQGAVSASKKSRCGTLRFRFAPPDGTRVLLTTVTTRVKKLEGQREQKDLVEVRSNLEYKSSRNGYLISEKLTSSNMTRDGLLGQDPVSSLLQDMEIKYYVSGDGKIDHIEGFGAVEQKAHSTLSENLKAVLLPRLKEEHLISQQIQDWNDRIADFVGREVAVGQTVDVQVPFALPNGQRVNCLMRTTFSGMEDCPAGKCLRIHTRYSSYQDQSSDLASSGSKRYDTRGGPQVYGTNSRLIDPSTMLIYSDETQRTMKMTAHISDHGVLPMTLTETRRHTFMYQ